MPARVAHPTGDLRHENNFIAGGKTGHSLPGLSHHPGHLVPLHDRITGVRVQPMIDMDIRPANANPLDLDQYFILGRFGLFNLAKFDLARIGHDCL